MNDKLRHLMCRAAFALLCLLPTILVVGWCAAAHTPFYRAYQRSWWESRLTNVLGLDVRIGRFSQPIPNVAALDDVRFLDLETGEQVATAHVLNAAFNNRRWIVLVDQLKIDGASSRQLATLFHDRLIRRSPQNMPPFEFIAKEVAIQRSNETQLLSEVTVSCRTEAARTEALLSFLLTGVEMSEPAQLKIVRDRSGSPPLTTWHFDTGNNVFPVSTLVNEWPALSRLGDSCRFSGLGQASCSAEGWNVEVVAGELKNIDLDRLVTDHFPHTLSGQADLALTKLQLKAGKLIEAEGTLHGEKGGDVSRSLLEAASRLDTLRLNPAIRLKSDTEPMWRYQELAVWFSLQPQGLELTGECNEGKSGALLRDQREPLLSESRVRNVAPVALIRMLTSPNDQQAITSPDAQFLLSLLPTTKIGNPSFIRQTNLLTPPRNEKQPR